MLDSKIREFIEAVRRSRSSLDVGWVSDPYHLAVLQEATQAIVLQFRAPDVAIIAFTNRANKRDLQVELAADIQVAAIPLMLNRRLDRYRALRFNDRLGEKNKSLSEILRRETEWLLRDAVGFGLRRQTGFQFFAPENLAIYRYLGIATQMNVRAVLARECAIAKAGRERKHPDRYFFKHSGHSRRVFAARFRKIKVAKRVTRLEEWLKNVDKGDENPWVIDPPLWKCTYNKVDVVIFSSGVIVADTPHKHLALEGLNSFLAASSFQGVVCPPVNAFDVGTANIDEHGRLESYGGPLLSMRNLYGTSAPIRKNILKKCMLLFQKSQRDAETLAQMRLYHSAVVHLLSGEHLQGFMLAWAVVEREIQRLWAKSLDDRRIEQKRKEKLLKNDDFTTNQLIEIAELLQSLDSTLYSESQRLRKIRNDVVHRGASPSQDQCAECIRLSKAFLQPKVRALIH
jgi:hypothetical protein